jgi:predicted nucleic acid-binding protein
MEWLNQLQGQVVGLDSAPLIYFIEQNPTYLEMARFFFRAADRGEFKIVTSVITIVEVLVYPFRQGNAELVRQYRNILFNEEVLTTIDIDSNIAESAAQLRASYNLQTPDAIQMAAAIAGGASFFFTNDARLPSLPNLQVLVLNELID